MTTARWVMSKRWGPSARCTQGTYTGPRTASRGCARRPGLGAAAQGRAGRSDECDRDLQRGRDGAWPSRRANRGRGARRAPAGERRPRPEPASRATRRGGHPHLVDGDALADRRDEGLDRRPADRGHERGRAGGRRPGAGRRARPPAGRRSPARAPWPGGPVDRQSVPTCGDLRANGRATAAPRPAGSSSTATIAAQPRRASPGAIVGRPPPRTTPATAAPASGTIPTCPSGAAAPCRATHSTHHSSAEVGRCSTPAIGGPTIPATRPPVSPQAMISAAAGSASRLAGTRRPPAARRTGRPAAGPPPPGPPGSRPAARRCSRGTGRWSASGRASTRMPADAATDSWKPSTPTSMRIDQHQAGDRQGQRRGGPTPAGRASRR